MTIQSFALSQDTILSTSDAPPLGPPPSNPQELVQLQNRIRADRLHAPEIVADALNANSREPILCVSTIVRAAIRALGKSISKLEVARLVKVAVETRTDAVLEIVRTAILETRPQLHRDILAAAVAAVPDPFIRVCVQHLREEPCVDEVFFNERKKFPFEEEVWVTTRVTVRTAPRWRRRSWQARLGPGLPRVWTLCTTASTMCFPALGSSPTPIASPFLPLLHFLLLLQ